MPIVKVIGDTKIPIKSWIPMEEVEATALEQLRNVANHPATIKHVAVMPDVHAGYGATIGTVMATEHAVIPGAVGVDIGCGMTAMRLPFKTDDILKRLPEIKHSIQRGIPTGRYGNKKITDSAMTAWDMLKADNFWATWMVLQPTDLKDKALAQIGSLGGGNHFIEICLDTEQKPWVMLHSGSRHIGSRIADYFIAKARDLMKAFWVDLPDPYLSFFPRTHPLFDECMQGIMWAQHYAWYNRVEMLGRILNDVSHVVVGLPPDKALMQTRIDCHHNFAGWENHFGRNMIITRKGAIRVRQGDYGIIPGSMGAKSFIVKGKGSPDSFMSCSHGAGRKMSRKQAREQFSVEDLKAQTQGVLCDQSAGVVDEIPAAYKPIETVMSYQSDLIEVMAELKQVMCIKGEKD